MADTLPKGYEPRDVEERWRAHWQDNKTFTPDPDAPGDPYCIVIPPPNVTGALHIGHALNQTLIDVLCRHARQKGKNVLWIPGTDHAGIATQNVVERALAREGKTRQDLGREAFIERVWQWREEIRPPHPQTDSRPPGPPGPGAPALHPGGGAFPRRPQGLRAALQ